MKTLLATRYVTIPEGVTVDVKSRVVTVTGPRGELVQSFKHLNLDLQKSGKNKLRVDLWFGNRKQVRARVGVCVGGGGAVFSWNYLALPLRPGGCCMFLLHPTLSWLGEF